ncbi:bi-domain-containing oxidoreductase [Salinibacter ruber]|uniref:bi-domain-containing oxidoreductase n=1 Tax=Salinibacter ruber TaxID=146919 RepID=UPI0021690569|nr:bi-domain-containing oxidoreductase [Salinibacter ruber]
MIELGQKSTLGMARARPDLVKKVINKARKEGWWKTFQTVQSKLDEPRPLGYSASGIVEEVGENVQDYSIGDRVALAGASYANHAEVNTVPKNLVARIPDNVTFESAAYTTVASIALQGIRLAEPQLGDRVAVIGLGLVGLLTVQMLNANGCRVLGIDLDADKVELAREIGLDRGCVSTASDPEAVAERFSRGHGVDHTLITAATSSSEPIEQAGALTRRKGEVVVVGNVGMDVPRDVYYEKELSLHVSMSYGPGRYDPSYEEGGVDYPFEYVRWTEQRNMQAVLDLMAQGKLEVDPLTTHTFDFENALDAYDLIREEQESYVGIVLEYDTDKEQPRVVQTGAPDSQRIKDRLGIGFIGAGNYATRFLLPHLEENTDADLRGLVTATGPSAEKKAEKFGFGYCTTEAEEVFSDEEIDAVFIATRHSTHAEFSVRGLEAGKHVFVEKPMVVEPDQLDAVIGAYEEANARRSTGLMVGLNRRFAPMVADLKGNVPDDAPLQMIYRVNSGAIPTDSWLHRPEEGGGMLIGEMVHFVDLMQHVSGEQPSSVFAESVRLSTQNLAESDNISITVTFEGGSVGTLCYNTVGDDAASKEQLEVYGGGAVARLDDFRELETAKNGSTSSTSAWNQDKGQAGEMERTVRSFREQGTSPVPLNQLVAGMQAVFAARKSLRDGEPVEVPRVELEQASAQ